MCSSCGCQVHAARNSSATIREAPRHRTTGRGAWAASRRSRIASRLGSVGLAADLGYRTSDSDAYFANFGPSSSYSEIRLDSLVFSPRLRWAFYGARNPRSAGRRPRLGGMGLRPPIRLLARRARYTRLEHCWRSEERGCLCTVQRRAGARHQGDGRHTPAARDGSPQCVRASAPSSNQSQAQTPGAGEIALSQMLAESWQVYAKLGTSFRVANVDENGATATGDLLKAQTARQGEAAAEYRRLGRRVRAQHLQDRPGERNLL